MYVSMLHVARGEDRPTLFLHSAVEPSIDTSQSLCSLNGPGHILTCNWPWWL